MSELMGKTRVWQGTLTEIFNYSLAPQPTDRLCSLLQGLLSVGPQTDVARNPEGNLGICAWKCKLWREIMLDQPRVQVMNKCLQVQKVEEASSLGEAG